MTVGPVDPVRVAVCSWLSWVVASIGGNILAHIIKVHLVDGEDAGVGMFSLSSLDTGSSGLADLLVQL